MRYHTLVEFKDNFLFDFSDSEQNNLFKFLIAEKEKYEQFLYYYINNRLNALLVTDDEIFTLAMQEEHINLMEIKKETENIIRFIEDEILSHKVKIRENPTKGETPPPIEEPPLTDKQIEKVGLFIRSGIIDFLREKNPKLNDSNLSKFLRELTSEYLKNAESVRPHLTKDTNSPKHPFYKDGSRSKFDLILQKYGISPPLEE